MITTSILRNSIDSIAWTGIIRDRHIGVVNRYRREVRLQRMYTLRLCILRNAHLLACFGGTQAELNGMISAHSFQYTTCGAAKKIRMREKHEDINDSIILHHHGDVGI